MARQNDTGRSEKRKAAKQRKTISKAWLYSLILGSFFLVTRIIFFVQREGGSEPWGIPAILRNPRPSTLSPALFAGPISGASMNPARSFGPALVTGHLDSFWIYLLAPVIGAYLAVLGCRCVQESGCRCVPQSSQEEVS